MLQYNYNNFKQYRRLITTFLPDNPWPCLYGYLLLWLSLILFETFLCSIYRGTDDVEKSLELLDKVLSEFEEEAEGSPPTEPESPSQGHQSEDDGYMSMNGRRWVQILFLFTFVLKKNKRSTIDNTQWTESTNHKSITWNNMLESYFNFLYTRMPHFLYIPRCQYWFCSTIIFHYVPFYRLFHSFFLCFFNIRAKFVPDFQPTDEVQSQPVIMKATTQTITTTPVTTTRAAANTVQEMRQDEQQNILSTSSLSPPSPEEAEKIILNLLPR